MSELLFKWQREVCEKAPTALCVDCTTMSIPYIPRPEGGKSSLSKGNSDPWAPSMSNLAELDRQISANFFRSALKPSYVGEVMQTALIPGFFLNSSSSCSGVMGRKT